MRPKILTQLIIAASLTLGSGCATHWVRGPLYQQSESNSYRFQSTYNLSTPENYIKSVLKAQQSKDNEALKRLSYRQDYNIIKVESINKFIETYDNQTTEYAVIDVLFTDSDTKNPEQDSIHLFRITKDVLEKEHRSNPQSLYFKPGDWILVPLIPPY